MNMKYFLAALIMMITFPLVAQAEVRINEIAWMGVTGTSGQYGEWFELYNNGPEPVSLTGWGVYKDGGTKAVFMLSHTIPAQGYLLVERTTASMPDPVSGIDDESGPFSNNGFANTGEHLVLKNSGGTIVHELQFAGGWPAGDSTTKETMQYNGTTWVTAVHTPKLPTANIPNSPSDEEEAPVPDVPAESGGGETIEETPTVTAQHSADKKKSNILPTAYSKNKPSVKIVVPSTVYQTVQYEYTATVVLEEGETKKGSFLWNMGDGTVVRTDTLSALRHSYQYPGVYTVTLSYHTAIEFMRPLLQSSAVVSVVASTVELSILNPETLQIKNTAKNSIDMSGWLLYTPEGYAEIPLFTILAPKGNIALPIDRVGLRTLTTATLKTKEGNTMAVLGSTEKTPQVVRSSTRLPPRLSFIPYATAAVTDTSVSTEALPISTPQTQQNRTKTIVLGAVVVVVTLLLLFLERFIARAE